jgi:hypothetical protein
METHDCFISHATEDKAEIARPLFEALRSRGYSVWFDEHSLKLGDSLRRSIDEGLSRCRFGIIILSPAFFAKQWPQYELNALTEREMAGRKKVVLPIWHNVTAGFVRNYSLALSGRYAALSSSGIPSMVERIQEVLGPPAAPPNTVSAAPEVKPSDAALQTEAAEFLNALLRAKIQRFCLSGQDLLIMDFADGHDENSGLIEYDPAYVEDDLNDLVGNGFLDMSFSASGPVFRVTRKAVKAFGRPR